MKQSNFYTISFKDYRNILKFRLSDFSLLDRLNQPNNDIVLRIYDNDKSLYRIIIHDNIIVRVYRDKFLCVKFESFTIKKDLLINSLKLLDSDISLNYILFLEILKVQLNGIA